MPVWVCGAQGLPPPSFPGNFGSRKACCSVVHSDEAFAAVKGRGIRGEFSFFSRCYLLGVSPFSGVHTRWGRRNALAAVIMKFHKHGLPLPGCLLLPDRGGGGLDDGLDDAGGCAYRREHRCLHEGRVGVVAGAWSRGASM